jgi:hypothetical protein
MSHRCGYGEESAALLCARGWKCKGCPPCFFFVYGFSFWLSEEVVSDKRNITTTPSHDKHTHSETPPNARGVRTFGKNMHDDMDTWPPPASTPAPPPPPPSHQTLASSSSAAAAAGAGVAAMAVSFTAGGSSAGAVATPLVPLPPRPNFGQVGKPIRLLANHFVMNAQKVPQLSLYDVQVTPPAPYTQRAGPVAPQQAERALPPRLCR